MANSSKDKKNYLYKVLREKLINCVYPPGSLLNEVQLAQEYGVSRTPIREAIGRLENEGYIQVIPKKGIYVTNISISDVLLIFQARVELEPIALKLAAPYLQRDEILMFKDKLNDDSLSLEDSLRLDTAMHLFIIEHCGNRYIIEMMRKVFDDNTRIVIASKQNQVKIHDAKKEHTQILDSLLNQDDISHTAELMRAHIETCRRAALDYFYSMNFTHSVPQTAQYKEELQKITHSGTVAPESVSIEYR